MTFTIIGHDLSNYLFSAVDGYEIFSLKEHFMNYDLHTHTTFSDGKNTVWEMGWNIAQNWVEQWCIRKK